MVVKVGERGVSEPRIEDEILSRAAAGDRIDALNVVNGEIVAVPRRRPRPIGA